MLVLWNSWFLVAASCKMRSLREFIRMTDIQTIFSYVIIDINSRTYKIVIPHCISHITLYVLQQINAQKTDLNT